MTGASRRNFLRGTGLTALAASALGASACGFGNSSEEPGKSGEKGGAKTRVLRITNTNFPVLDPQLVAYGMWILLQGILEPLVLQNDKGTDVVPGVAEKWTASDDGLVYTFTLRNTAKWSNGKPVVAKDFERTYKRLLTPAAATAGGATTGANSYQPSTGIKNADAFLAGTLTDWSQVGVKAKSDAELEFTLANPNPGFLLSLTHPSMLPLHMDTVEAKPKDWGEVANFVSNGPYKVKAWTKNSSMTLVPNPSYWDQDQVKLDRIDVKLVEQTGTTAPTVPYENGEVDLVALTDVDIERFQKDAKLSKEVQAIPSRSWGYLAKMRSKNPVLEDVRVRKALSLGLGRDTLSKIQPGLRPATSLVPDTVPGWDDSITFKEDITEAKRLLAAAGYPDGKGFPTVSVLSGAPFPITEAIVANWKKNLGINAKTDVVETGLYVERRWKTQPADYVGFYYGSFSGSPSWSVLVQTLWGPKEIQMLSLPWQEWDKYQALQADTKLPPAERTAQLSGILDKSASPGAKKFAELTTQATSSPDEAQQLDLFKQAAKQRDEEFLYNPVIWGDTFFAVKPAVTGLTLRASAEFFYFRGISVKG